MYDLLLLYPHIHADRFIAYSLENKYIYEMYFAKKFCSRCFINIWSMVLKNTQYLMIINMSFIRKRRLLHLFEQESATAKH